jgi:hypothetical protein
MSAFASNSGDGGTTAPNGAAATDSQSAEQGDGLDALMDMFAPEEPAKPVEEDDPDEQLEGLSERAQKRFRNLSGRSKQLKEELATLQGQLGEYSTWSQQAYQTMTQQNAQMQALRAELESLRRGGYPGAPVEKAEPEPTDEVGKFKRALEQELLSKADAKLSPQIKQALEAVERLEKQRDQERRQYEMHQKQRYYNSVVDKALDAKIAPLMDPEVFNSMKGHLGGMILSLAQVRPDGDINLAAETLVRIAKDMTRGIVKAHKGKIGQKVAAQNALPARAEGGRSGTVKDATPTMAQLRKAGFKNHLEWGMRGRPPLR